MDGQIPGRHLLQQPGADMVGISHSKGPGIVGQFLILAPSGIGDGVALEKDHIVLCKKIMNILHVPGSRGTGLGSKGIPATAAAPRPALLKKFLLEKCLGCLSWLIV